MWSIVCKNKLETIATWHFIWQNVVTIYIDIYIYLEEEQKTRT